MADFEVIALNPATPQLRVPGAGDGYSMPSNVNLGGFQLTAGTIFSNGDISATFSMVSPTYVVTGTKISFQNCQLTELSSTSFRMESLVGLSTKDLQLRRLRTEATTVGSLGSAATAGVGTRSMVTNATQTLIAGLGTVVASGGTNIVPVYSDGTNWIIG